MNVNTLQDHTETFQNEISVSGFLRDLNDYSLSLPSSESNILALREIAENILISLRRLYGGDLPRALQALLPSGKPRPFTESNFLSQFDELVTNKEITLSEFYQKLSQLITELIDQITRNDVRITEIKKFISPFTDVENQSSSAELTAIISVIFHDSTTTASLKTFSRTLSTWNRILPVYHQLVKSDSPRDIGIEEIQSGSIDVLLNIDVDVAVNLAELFELGFKVFAAYLSYKKMVRPLIDSYYGNEKLISQEDERERLLLSNIGEAVSKRIIEQHERELNGNPDHDQTSITRKVSDVSDLITSHIVRGNDFKLLALPPAASEDPDAGAKTLRKESLKVQSIEARRELQGISDEDKTKLLETYKINHSSSEESGTSVSLPTKLASSKKHGRTD